MLRWALSERKRGQTATEYGLILFLVVIIIMSGLAFIGSDMETFMSTVNSGLAKALD